MADAPHLPDDLAVMSSKGELLAAVSRPHQPANIQRRECLPGNRFRMIHSAPALDLSILNGDISDRPPYC